MIYFAWVDVGGSAGANEFGPEHLVHDENIIAFSVEHNEGDFATLTMEVENPRRGPLAPGPIWAWLSWQDDANPSDDAVPIFFGRLIGVPSGIIGNIITYIFRARPSDYQDIKSALADSLRVLPFYDEIFIDESAREDPDVVLEGYTKAWHIDRITHEVTVSEFLIGEDGVEVFDPAEVIYDSVDITLDRPPLTSVIVDAEIPFTQSFNGLTVNIGLRQFSSFGALQSWPKVGDTLAGGYVVLGSFAEDPNYTLEPTNAEYHYQNDEKTHEDGDVMTTDASSSLLNPLAPSGTWLVDGEYSVPGDKDTGTPFRAGFLKKGFDTLYSNFQGSLTLGVDAKRDMKDKVSLMVVSNLQPVLRDPEDTSDSETISLGSANVGHGCGTGDPPPIGNSNRSQYAPIDRGFESIKYMVLRARARLVIGARVVSISWQCPFSRALSLSCRKTAMITDPRIPGGVAIGKIVSYSLRGDGRSGEFRGTVKISCAVGLGDAIEVSDGEADYVDVDYVDDYQTFTGQIVALPSEDIGVSPPTPVNSSGSVFVGSGGVRDLVLSDEIVCEAGDTSRKGVSMAAPQNLAEVAAQQYEGYLRAAQAAAAVQCYRRIELVNLNGPGAETDYTAATTPLVIPRQIDLEAASTG